MLNEGIDLMRNLGGQPTHRFQFLRQSKFNFSLLTKARLPLQLGDGLSQTLGSRNVALRPHLPDDTLETRVGQMPLNYRRIRCAVLDRNNMAQLGSHCGPA